MQGQSRRFPEWARLQMIVRRVKKDRQLYFH
jgi:hypothetical protein